MLYTGYPYSGHIPDQGYLTYQPATLDQLGRVYGQIDHVIDFVNTLIDESQTDKTRLDQAVNDIAKIINTITIINTQISDIITDIKNNENNITTINKELIVLNKKISDLNTTIDTIITNDFITQLLFIPTDKGLTLRTRTHNNDGHDHTLIIKGDNTINSMCSTKNNTTEWELTTKNTISDPTTHTIKPHHGGWRQYANTTELTGQAIESSDDFITIITNPHDDKTVTTNITMGNRYINDINTINKHRVMKTISFIKTKDNEITQRLHTSQIDGNKPGTLDYTHSIFSHDNSVITHVDSHNNNTTIDITAKDQTRSLPHYIQRLFITQPDSEKIDHKTININADIYNPKTQTVTKEFQYSHNYDCDNTMMLDHSNSDTITFSALPTLEGAKNYCDELESRLITRLNELEKQNNELIQHINELDKEIEEAHRWAKTAVYNATLNVEKTPDNKGIIATTTLYTRDHTHVIALPLKLRFLSPQGDLKTGVELGGDMSTITLDFAH